MKSFKSRIMMIGLIIMCISLIGVITLIVYFRYEIEKTVRNDNNAMTEAISNQVFNAVEKPIHSALDAIIFSEGIYDDPDKEITTLMESMLRSYTFIHEIMILDYEGNLINMAPYRYTHIGDDMTHQPYFMNSGLNQLTWTGVFVSTQNNRPSISATYRTENRIIVFIIDLHSMPLNLESANPFEEVTELALIDKYGTYIMSDDLNNVYLRNTHAAFQINEPERTFVNGTERVVIKRISELNWYIVYTFDLSLMYREINFVTLIAISGWVVLVLFIWIIVGINLSRITNNFQELSKLTSSVIKGDYTPSNHDFVYEEFEKLVVDFENMQEVLNSRDIEIRELTRGLEAKVINRTSQLLETNEQLKQEIEERHHVETKLIQLNENLDKRINDKTFELERVNRQLVKNIQAVEEANNAKSNFLAVMSHEMRTPLNGIIGFLQMMNRDTMNEENKELAIMIRNSSDVLLALINDVLDVSKYEAGRGSFEVVSFDAQQVIMKGIEPFRKTADKKNVNFISELDDLQDVFLLGDRMKIVQLLSNLLNNALKFTSEGYVKLKVRIKEVESRYHISIVVEDSGIGMKEEVRPYLFKPFAQADSSITREFGGTGLGLTICKRIVEHYNGIIDYTSEFGVGTKFTVKLIMDKGIKINRETVHKKIVELKTQGNRIMLAEDNEVNQKLVVKFFERYGKHCDIAVNGAEAVKMASEKAYDIIFMDCNMPLMDGYDATKEIRTFDEHVRIYAMTAYASKEDHEKCIESGMDGVFTKPIDFHRLEETMGLESYVPIGEEDLHSLKENGLKNAHIMKLVHHFDFDEETCEDLLDTYLAQAKAFFADIDELYRLKDVEGIAIKLHQMKGASGAVRLDDHKILLESAEKMVEKGEVSSAINLVHDFMEDPLFDY